MLSCGHECYVIGGPFIAEDPACPVHGTQAQRHELSKEGRNERIKEILCEVWYRSMSADDAWDEIEDLLD